MKITVTKTESFGRLKMIGASFLSFFTSSMAKLVGGVGVGRKTLRN